LRTAGTESRLLPNENALEYGPLGISLAWLFFDGPRFFVDDLQFLIEVLIVTALTRSVGVRLGVSALAWGIGIVAPLTVAIGWGLSASGFEMTSGAGNGVIVPLVEELGSCCRSPPSRWSPDGCGPRC
jgi:hypothetical protein